MHPECIFFDFDGTLAHYEPDSFDTVCDFCAEIGQPLSASVKWRGRRLEHEYFAAPVVREWIESLSPEEFWVRYNHRLLEGMGIEGDLDGLAGQLSRQMAGLNQVLRCPDAVSPTLATLRERGYRSGLITNRVHVDRFRLLLEQIGLDSQFEVTLAAGEVGVRKPDPGIFQIALERAGAAADRSLYVGDNYWADVVGAQRAGMTPVLLDPLHLFPEAECQVLERIDDLLAWLP